MALSDCILGKEKMLAPAPAGEIIQYIQHVCELGYFVLFWGLRQGHYCSSPFPVLTSSLAFSLPEFW